MNCHPHSFDEACRVEWFDRKCYGLILKGTGHSSIQVFLRKTRNYSKRLEHVEREGERLLNTIPTKSVSKKKTSIKQKWS